jgi:hypothetical protein
MEFGNDDSNPTTCPIPNDPLDVPISFLGDTYASQTRDRSQCVRNDKGEEYCTCVFECGNGVWECVEGVYFFKQGCKKYCHGGECDGDGA